MKKNLLLLPLAAFGVLATQACGTLKTYKVAFSVDQHIHYEDKVAYNNYDYVNKIQVDQGYYLTKYDFTIKVGDNALSFDEFSYDNYVLTIPKKFISSNISVTAASTTFNGYPVTFDNDDKGSWTGDSHTTLGDDYIASLSLNPSYRMRASTINVAVNNNLIPQYSTGPDGSFVKNYDFDNNKLTINKSAITGPLHISHHPFKVFKLNYTQTESESHVRFAVPSGTEFMKNAEVIVPLQILDGYAIDAHRIHIVAQDSQKELVVDEDFRFSVDSLIFFQKATSIETLESYTVTFNLGISKPYNHTDLKNMLLRMDAFYVNENVENFIQPTTDYKLPATITVKKKVGETTTTLVQNQDYTYDNRTGRLTITSEVTSTADEIILIGEAEASEYIKVHFHGEHVSLERQEPTYDKVLSFFRGIREDIPVIVDEGYHLVNVVITTPNGYVMPPLSPERTPNVRGRYVLTFPAMYLMTDTNLYFNAAAD